MKEWLETNGLGGFALGSQDLIPRRRYHGLLIASARPPLKRLMLVNAVDVTVRITDTKGRDAVYALSSFHYPQNTTHPHGHEYISSFSARRWPTWTYNLPCGLSLEQELFCPHDTQVVALSWKVKKRRDIINLFPSIEITIRPLLSGRDFHSLHLYNEYFCFDTFSFPHGVGWKPYPDIPEIVCLNDGMYFHEPLWFHNLFYSEEHARGFDFREDLASPGKFQFSLAKGDAHMIFLAPPLLGDKAISGKCREVYKKLRTSEQERRKVFPSLLHKAADSYIVKRDDKKSIIAGYPWFGDWGRDTCIALRGLCITTEQFSTAEDTLLLWRKHISGGMLPNLFPERADEAWYNSVDASLWYVVTAYEYLKRSPHISTTTKDSLVETIADILTHYSNGTRFGVKCDEDGLVKAGVRGVQLTWMDGKVGQVVFTPRIGKPVEVQALWINALKIAVELGLESWKGLAERAQASFTEKFWNGSRKELFDVIDVDHLPGRLDPSSRPNQMFAVGGLPFSLLEIDKARAVVDAVERNLLTPHGLRTLSPSDPNYTPHYRGNPFERDSGYHQGTAWPWLLASFVEGWIRVRGDTPKIKREATRRFVAPLLKYAETEGFGHLFEIADGHPPHTPRGCPFQAWSLGEMIRLKFDILAPATGRLSSKDEGRLRPAA
jgi:predicted glycogen debranching enzyme